MTTKLHDQVYEWMRTFKPEELPQAARAGLGFPGVVDENIPNDVLRLRLALVFEEAFELLAACLPFSSIVAVDVLWAGVRKAIDSASSPVPDIVGAADALADIDYVVEGMRLVLGINGEPIADAVHASNMAKAGGHRREDGKWVKPPGWKAPDIVGELRKQGWEGWRSR